MNEMEKRKKLVDYINSMNDDEVIELHNSCCEYADDCIYGADELDELLDGRTPTDILCMSFYGEFNPQHKFFWFNGYGNLESADYISNMPISAEDIADYILLNEDSLGNDEIQEILDKED